MAWHKKGTWAWADLTMWLFYLPLTAAVIYAIVTVPQGIIKTSVQPVELDAAIFQERTFQHLADYSPVTGANDNTLTPDVEQALAYSLSQKKFGYKITIDGKKFAPNEEFYDIAAPLAPVLYYRFTANKNLKTATGTITVTVDQVYPKKYETFR